jgi:hypothetical protein
MRTAALLVLMVFVGVLVSSCSARAQFQLIGYIVTFVIGGAVGGLSAVVIPRRNRRRRRHEHEDLVEHRILAPERLYIVVATLFGAVGALLTIYVGGQVLGFFLPAPFHWLGWIAAIGGAVVFVLGLEIFRDLFYK